MSFRPVACALAALAILLPPGPSGSAKGEETGRSVLELEAREAALRLLEADVAKKIEELEQLREAAAAAILPQEQEQAAQLATLIKFYQAMKPSNAAQLLEKLPSPLAAKLLAAMQARSAGKILNVMNTDRAVVISRLMAGRN